MQYTSKEVYEYVSKKTNDPIVEWKKCRLSWQDFPIYQSDLEFYNKVSPTFEVPENYAKEFLEKNNDVKDNFEYKDGKLKAKIPTPTLCPEERERRRFAFRNESNLYRRKCDFSWKSIISIFSPDKEYKVYDYPIWFSDTWTPESIEINLWTKSVFDSLNSLLHIVPFWSKHMRNNENSDYVNIVADSKNSYMCFASNELEDCLYSRYGISSKNCVDCLSVENSENCYDCVKVNHCFKVFHSDNCESCSNSSYLNNCINCHDCFNCSDLENQSYCINNQQYTKEEYEQKINDKPKSLLHSMITIWCRQVWCNNCFWNNIINSHNCSFVSNSTECENVKYTLKDLKGNNSHDVYFSPSDLCFYMVWCRYSHSCGFIAFWTNLKNSWYCVNCFDSSYCFWCVGLKNKEYCIYNKQYTKDEYNQIVPQMIAEMMRNHERGEFLDPQLSYYWYNESIAMDYYPITKEEALWMWYKRSDYDSPLPRVEKFVPWEKLPKVGCKIIKEQKPEFLNKLLNYAIVCEVSKRPFRITKQEIDFYVKHNLSLPTKHPDIRHQERSTRKDPTTLHLIHCDGCWEEMLSVYEKQSWKKILCEKCFYKNM